MTLHLPADPGDPGQPRTTQGRVEKIILRPGGGCCATVQVLAHGALVCPECALPLAIDGQVSAGMRLHCAFCDHAAPAREFIAEDVYDTVANEVYLVARVA